MATQSGQLARYEKCGAEFGRKMIGRQGMECGGSVFDPQPDPAESSRCAAERAVDEARHLGPKDRWSGFAEAERKLGRWKSVEEFVDDCGITCDCCQHVMIDVTSVLAGEKQHCIAGDPEGDGAACAHGMHEDQGRQDAALEELMAAAEVAGEFIADELAVRRASFLPDPQPHESYDIVEAEQALHLIRAAIAKCREVLK